VCVVIITDVSDVIQYAYDRKNFTFQLAIACEVDEVLITDGNMDGVASILHYAFSVLIIPDKTICIFEIKNRCKS
jgi:hypothetical protein